MPDNLDDILSATRIFPDAFALFSHVVPPLETACENCDVVLDTNVLLLPYTTGGRSLKEIKSVYAALQKKRRLFIPGQVAREFARNRTTKITEIYKTLSDRRSRAQSPQTMSYPLLADLAEYKQLVAEEEDLAPKLSAYQDAAMKVLDAIRHWGWNDPVYQMYRSIFTRDTIRESTKTNEEVLADLRDRIANKIPPGYKDAGKDDDGVGDLLIWLTILEIGSDRKKPLLFVSGDEKADWQYRIDNRGFLPRYELIDEYRRASSGQPFYIATFSKLLELFGAPTEVVTEVRDKEDDLSLELESSSYYEISLVSVDCPYCGAIGTSNLGTSPGATARCRCAECRRIFNVHRRGTGEVFSRIIPSRRNDDEPSLFEEGNESVVILQEAAECPGCGTPNSFRLGEPIGSTSMPRCIRCGNIFYAHRGRGGDVIIRNPRVSR